MTAVDYARIPIPLRRFLLVAGAFLSVASHPARAFGPADVDAYFEAHWKARGLQPAPAASDGAFLRRAWLDIAGVVPPVQAVLELEEDGSPDRRLRIVDALLEDPRYPEAWAARLRDLLVTGDPGSRVARQTRPFDRWLETMLHDRIPFDEIAARMIAGVGAFEENPEVGFVAQYRDNPEALTGHMAKTFLGVQIQCAQCHDHPFEKWTRKDFYGLLAFFARTRAVPIPAEGMKALREGRLEALLEMGKGPDGQKARKGLERRARLLERVATRLPPPSVEPDAMSRERMDRMKERGKTMRTLLLVDRPRGEAVMPDLGSPEPEKGQRPSGEPIRPRFLDGTTPPWPDPGQNRRELLARWISSPANPYFARAIVNRVWSIMLGRGLVDPVDNIAAPEDSTHAGLLETLGRHFVETRFDLAGLIRLIASTRVYQLSMTQGETPAKPSDHVSAPPRPLEPEVFFRSLVQATGVEEALRRKGEAELERMRSRWMRGFLRVFENDDAGSESGESFHGSLGQALFLMNSPAVNRVVRAGNRGRLGEAMKLGVDAGVARLYRAAFARPPAEEELRRARTFLAGTRAGGETPEESRFARALAWSDLFWAMLASAEFVVNH